MPQIERKLSRFLNLPELKIIKFSHDRTGLLHQYLEKASEYEVCPRCAVICRSVYDRRRVMLRDAPVRGVGVVLHVLKRRFLCGSCRRPFTESIPGVLKGRRTTERYRRSLLWACENFVDLKKVRIAYRCSTWLIYSTLYRHLDLKLRQNLNYEWPSTVGIDEHFVSRVKGYKEFATVVVDYNNKRVFDLVNGRTKVELSNHLRHIKGRENVRNAILDLSDTYRGFIKEFFPNAELIADKFHVLRLLSPAINRRRKEITGDKRSNPVRKLLLRNANNLEYFERSALNNWLNEHRELQEIYHYKEALHGFYRIKGYGQAARVLTKITDRMALTELPEIKTLRKTLMKWRTEILNYFKNRLTNARTEGFNNVAKLVQKRSYGVKSFALYRLKYLNACF